MRKTLIIKGVPKDNDEDSWDKTEIALTASISNVCDIDQDSAYIGDVQRNTTREA